MTCLVFHQSSECFVFLGNCADRFKWTQRQDRAVLVRAIRWLLRARIGRRKGEGGEPVRLRLITWVPWERPTASLAPARSEWMSAQCAALASPSGERGCIVRRWKGVFEWYRIALRRVNFLHRIKDEIDRPLVTGAVGAREPTPLFALSDRWLAGLLVVQSE